MRRAALLACCAVVVAGAAYAEPAQVVDYYGDSTVWGYASGSGRRVATPAPAAFAAALAEAPIRYAVRNEGVNGSTACDLLRGADGRHPNWDRQMAASDAHYVFLNFAINDQWKYDLATYKSCLRGLARGARAAGKTVLFETPNPTRDSGPGGLDAYVDAMRELAKEEGVPLIDQYRHLNEYLAGRSPYAICPDGLHPTEAVYEMKGRYAAAVFMQLFPRAGQKWRSGPIDWEDALPAVHGGAKGQLQPARHAV